jgi:hypothetical protein
MKRIIFSFVYVCVALCILAETTMFDRSQQGLNAIVKEQPVKTSNAQDKSLSLQRVLKERHNSFVANGVALRARNQTKQIFILILLIILFNLASPS